MTEDRYDQYKRARREYDKAKSGLDEILFPDVISGTVSLAESLPSVDEVFERACADVDVWSGLINEMVKDHLQRRMSKIEEARLRAVAELRSFGSR